MKLSTIILSLAMAVILLPGCKSTGQRALQKGNYYTASIQAIKKLRSSPDNDKALSALKQAYPLLINTSERQIDALLTSNAVDKYKSVYLHYKDLNSVSNEILQCPPALRMFPNAYSYTSELSGAANFAAAESYQRAESEMNIGTRQAFRNAYELYLEANSFSSGYKDALYKAAEAKDLATLKIVVEQVPVTGAYKLSADFFQNQVFEYLSNNIRNEFVRVYSPEEAEKSRIIPDQIVRLQFLNFVVGQTKQLSETTEVTRDNVIIGTTKDRQNREKNVYGTVKAKLTVNRIEIASTGILDAFIIEYGTNKTLSHKRFPGTFVWADRWASFNGDERALTDEQLDLCDHKPVPPPPPQDLFIQFTVPIFNSLKDYMQSYYRYY